jgi:hypothetical protein
MHRLSDVLAVIQLEFKFSNTLFSDHTSSSTPSTKQTQAGIIGCG